MLRNPIVWIDILDNKTKLSLLKLQVTNGKPNCHITLEQGADSTSTASINLYNINQQAWNKIRQGNIVNVYFSFNTSFPYIPNKNILWFSKYIINTPITNRDNLPDIEYKLILGDYLLGDYYNKPISTDLRGKTLSNILQLLQQDIHIPIIYNLEEKTLEQVWLGGNPSKLHEAFDMINKQYQCKHYIYNNAYYQDNSYIYFFNQPKSGIKWDLTKIDKAIELGMPQIFFSNIDGVVSEYKESQIIRYHFRTLLNTKINVGDQVKFFTNEENLLTIGQDIKFQSKVISITQIQSEYNSNGECICDYWGQEYVRNA